MQRAVCIMVISSCDLFCVATGKSKRDLESKLLLQFQSVCEKYDLTKTYYVSGLFLILYPLSDDYQKRDSQSFLIDLCPSLLEAAV